MDKTNPATLPEAAKADVSSQSHSVETQPTPEHADGDASTFAQRSVLSGSSSLQTPPESFAPFVNSTQGSPTRRAGVLRQLQRSYGNHYVGRVIQAKLAVSQPRDEYEQEADRVADALMDTQDTSVGQQLTISPLTIASLAQRKCSMCEEQDDRLQLKPASGGSSPTGLDMENHLKAMQGGGQSLADQTRAYFEPRLGYDLSEVRIHTDARASEAARALNAHAYTLGTDIVFNTGHYAPKSSTGRHLLAHELVHTIQQTGGKPLTSQAILSRSPGSIQRKEDCSKCGSEDEETKAAVESLHPALELPPSKIQKRKSAYADHSSDPAERQADEIGARIGADLTTVSSVLSGPIPGRVRAIAEKHLGVSLAGTELRAGSEAHRKATSERAIAVTESSTISFGEGQLATATSRERELLGHELTHVAQQRAAGISATQRQEPANGGESAEVEATAEAPDTVPAELIAPITSEMAAELSEDKIFGVLVLTRMLIQKLGKDDPNLPILKENVEVLKGALEKVCGEGDAGMKDSVKQEDLLVRLAGGEASNGANLYVVRASEVLYAQRTGSEPRTSGSNQPAASMPEPASCEAFDQAAVDAAFAAIGAGAGEETIVHPGDGIYLMAQIRLMEQEGVSFEEARRFAFSQLFPNEDIEKVREELSKQEAETPTQEEGEVTDPAVAGALPPGRAKVPPRGKGVFNPKGQPQDMYTGNECHAAVFSSYASRNPMVAPDASVWSVLNGLGFTAKQLSKLPKNVVIALDLRPDIYDGARHEIFEIKPFESTALAIAEAMFYIGIFKAAGISNVKMGNPENPGTSGISAAPGGWCVFMSPAPGAIVHEYTQGNPRRLYEFMRDEIAHTQEHGFYEMMGQYAYRLHGPVGTNAAIALAVGFAELLVGLALLGAEAGPVMGPAAAGAGGVGIARPAFGF